MHCGIVVQARMSSVRLPGKMLMHLGDMPLLLWVLRRCATVGSQIPVILATSTLTNDDPLAYLAKQAGFACVRGSLTDVRSRFVQAARDMELQVLCRVCGDSPFVDPDGMTALMQAVCHKHVQYARLTDTLPGFISEAFSVSALITSTQTDTSSAAQEHVTTGLRNRPDLFAHQLIQGLPCSDDYPPLTVDTRKDFDDVTALVTEGCVFDTPCSLVLARMR